MNLSKIYLIMLLCAVVPLSSIALESDRDQDAEIEADFTEYDELAGLNTYSGNVVYTQGSIELLADEIQLRMVDNEVVELVAYGSPARYEQMPELDGEKLIASGDKIHYLLEENLVELSGSASLSQQGTTLSGGTILYDVRQHVLKASSSTTEQNTTERVRVVLPPLGGTQQE